jgi:outer membrane cobalamin receptor
MKTLPKLIFLTILLAATAAFGSEKKDSHKTRSVDESAKAKPVVVEKKDGILLTGSRVKQDVRRAGRITDASSQVLVIDRQAIERSGGADLRQVLIQTGVR